MGRRRTTRNIVRLEGQAATFVLRLRSSPHDRDQAHLAVIASECELMAMDDVPLEKTTRSASTRGRTKHFVVPVGELSMYARKRRRRIVIFKIRWRSPQSMGRNSRR